MSMIITSSYSSSLAVAQNSHQHPRHLPTPSKHGSIIIGYAHNAKSGKAEQAILDGINVIIWSFVHLDVGVSEEDVTTITQQKQQQQKEQQGEDGQQQK